MTFNIPKNVQKINEDILDTQLKYHNKRVLVSKEFTFDSAHHLHCYDGKCKNLHGHTYKVVLAISGFVDFKGISIDFGFLKDIYKKRIHDKLDHKYLNEVLPPMNTTAENMVVWMFEQLQHGVNEHRLGELVGARVEFVRLYETPTAYAEITREWMTNDR